MPKRLRTVLRFAAGCILMGAIPGFFGLLFGGLRPRDLLQWSLYGIVYSSCIAVPSFLTLPLAARALDRRPVSVRTAVYVGILIGFSITGCLLANFLFLTAGLLNIHFFWRVYLHSLKMSVLIALAVGLLVTAFRTLEARLNETRAQLHARQIAEERERKTAAEARYASLASRVHPHFLFNTLNSISALVRENPAEAERMIERLSSLLRYSLDSEISGLVPLRDELHIVHEYLAIEQVRFGARLRYLVASDPDAADCLVPALSVQTLVENSVKYAVGSSRTGAEILVSATLTSGALRVTVSDDGPGFEPALSLRPGHGLDLLRQRLETLFGSAATLDIATVNQRMEVAFLLPAA